MLQGGCSFSHANLPLPLTNACLSALRMRNNIEVARDVLLVPVSWNTTSLAWCPLCSGHVRCPEGSIAFPALRLYRYDLGFVRLASSYVQPKL